MSQPNKPSGMDAMRAAARAAYQQKRAIETARVQQTLLNQDQARAQAAQAASGIAGATTAAALDLMSETEAQLLKQRQDRLRVVQDLRSTAERGREMLDTEQGGPTGAGYFKQQRELERAGIAGTTKDALTSKHLAEDVSRGRDGAGAGSGLLSRVGHGRRDRNAGPSVPEAPRREANLMLSADEAQQKAVAAVNSIAREKTDAEYRAERQEMLKSKRDKIQAQRESLPVRRVKDDFIKTVRENQVVVVLGETGSGKTTQLPQYLWEAGFGKIVCTQPRRLAATSVAERVAVEAGVKCGGLVGYKVRFDDKTSDRTEISFFTDGMMLKEIVQFPDLEPYGCVMIDEAHERSVSSDILLGFLRDLIRRRKDIKVIVASATLEASKFSDFFMTAPCAVVPTTADSAAVSDFATEDAAPAAVAVAEKPVGPLRPAPLFKITGRTFPVKTFYVPEPQQDYVEAAATAAIQTHLDKPLPGDILVFLPGQEDIEKCADMITNAIQSLPAQQVRHVLVRPVFSTLPPEQQKLIYETTPADARKVVIATNIAETSITVDGIVYVIDCGLCKQKYYEPSTGIESLSIVPISRAAAEQRKGRAGRTCPGECLRLFTKYMLENELEKSPVPEILRSSLASIVLNLKALGVQNPVAFDFLDAPSPKALCGALDTLALLGALNRKGGLSKIGRMMAALPLEPPIAKALVQAQEKYKCAKPFAIAAAMLSLQNSLFVSPGPNAANGGRDQRQAAASAQRAFFNETSGDVSGYVKVFQLWEEERYSAEWAKSQFLNINALHRAKDVRNQLVNTMAKLFPNELTDEPDMLIADQLVTQALLSGFFYNTARINTDGLTFLVPHSKQETWVHPGSSLSPLFRRKDQPQGGPFGMQSQEQQTSRIQNVAEGERPALIVFTELRRTKKAYMTHCSVVLREWVVDAAPPNFFSAKDLDATVMTRKAM